MTNKELAVQLYAAVLQSSATLMSHPRFSGIVKQPTAEDMLSTIKLLTEGLSQIEDN